jgi:predicted metal-dependent phosphotriesterase family hydrolase
VTGPVRAADLGRTLMHEHLTVGYPGFEAHTSRPGPNRADMVTVCVERIRQLQELGYSSMLDPCPSDLGCDVELMVEVAEATGFNIICATGLYKEEEGGTAYWRFKGQFEDVGAVMADLFHRRVDRRHRQHRGSPRDHQVRHGFRRHDGIRAHGLRGSGEGVGGHRGTDHHPHGPGNGR